MASYRNQEVDPRTAGSALRVDTLLTGSYIREGDNLRITRATGGCGKDLTKLWSDTIDMRYDNLLAVNDRVASKIISGLELNLTPSQIEVLKLDNPTNRAAYEDYLRGVDRYAMNDFKSSIELLEKSTALDPTYSPAWTNLGRAYEANGNLQFGGREQYRKARDSFQKALSLNPAAVEPRVYMANLLTDTGQVEDAVPLLRDALKGNPNSALAHWELGYAYRFGGLLEDSARECELARRIDPSVKIYSSAINAYFYMGHYDQWLAVPDNNAAYILFYRGMGELYKGDTAHALTHFDLAYDLDPALLQADVGKAMSSQIRHENATGIQLLREVESKILDRGVTDPEGIYKVAQAYAMLGDKPSAMRLFRQTILGGFFCYPCLVKRRSLDRRHPPGKRVRGVDGAGPRPQPRHSRPDSYPAPNNPALPPNIFQSVREILACESVAFSGRDERAACESAAGSPDSLSVSSQHFYLGGKTKCKTYSNCLYGSPAEPRSPVVCHPTRGSRCLRASRRRPIQRNSSRHSSPPLFRRGKASAGQWRCESLRASHLCRLRFPRMALCCAAASWFRNFNNSANLQGTGTTIVQISPAGQTSLFFTSTQAGRTGLSAALGIRSDGIGIAGYLPSTDGTSQTAGPGGLLVNRSPVACS